MMVKENSLSLDQSPSPYIQFTREQWCQFRKNTPLTLTEADLAKLQGKNEVVSLQEVEEIYLPLSRLLSFYVMAAQSLHNVTEKFLGHPEPKVPFIIGVAGSVAVGKSTTSRVLQALLSRWPDHPNVVVVTTDGFLYPNAELEKRGLMERKGFPESYDLQNLLNLLHDIKAGKNGLRAPVYSHHVYDILPNEYIDIDQPDVVILEGLNILQTGMKKTGQPPRIFVSDFFDFSIFVDAEPEVIKRWFIDRVLLFCRTTFKDPSAFFHHLSTIPEAEMAEFAEKVWHEINEANLFENILPFKERAQLILSKAPDHSIAKVFLRKL